jgi:hypothetical protein
MSIYIYQYFKVTQCQCRTHNGRNYEWQDYDPVVWISMQNISPDLMVLEPADGANNKDVESRWENNREHKGRSGAGMTEDKSQDGKNNGKKCRYDGCELGTFTKRDGDEEGPAG